MSTKLHAATRLVAGYKQTEYLDLRISGSPQAIQILTNMLAAIEWNCNVGHSCIVAAPFDGDGADKIVIEGLPEANKKLGQEMANACSSYGDSLMMLIQDKTSISYNTRRDGTLPTYKSTMVYPKIEEE